MLIGKMFLTKLLPNHSKSVCFTDKTNQRGISSVYYTLSKYWECSDRSIFGCCMNEFALKSLEMYIVWSVRSTNYQFALLTKAHKKKHLIDTTFQPAKSAFAVFRLGFECTPRIWAWHVQNSVIAFSKLSAAGITNTYYNTSIMNVVKDVNEGRCNCNVWNLEILKYSIVWASVPIIPK